MSLTKLDTASALIVIDLQKGILGLPAVHPAEIIRFLENSRETGGV